MGCRGFLTSFFYQRRDGHAKNFSVFLEKGGGFHLTPLYDIMSTAPLTASGVVSPRRIKMAIGLLGKNKHYRFSEIEPRHFPVFDRKIMKKPLKKALLSRLSEGFDFLRSYGVVYMCSLRSS